MNEKILKIDRKDLKKFEKLLTTGCEGDFYFYDTPNERKLIKILRDLNNRYTRGGLENIKVLNQHINILAKEFPELVLPEKLVIVDKELCGYTMQYIKGMPLNIYLQAPNISFKEKIYILKSIGIFLEKLSYFKFPFGPIVLGDLHEENILVDEDGKIKIIDLNGIFLESNEIPNCKYLIADNGFYFNKPKYIVDITGDVVPNQNTDILCYCMIIMNFITKSEFYKLRDYQINEYLKYMKIINFPIEFTSCIAKLYSRENNQNPYLYLDYITLDMLEQSSMENYYKAKHALKQSYMGNQGEQTLTSTGPKKILRKIFKTNNKLLKPR